jgi:hypothetical protein
MTRFPPAVDDVARESWKPVRIKRAAHYGNCPPYIQSRALHFLESAELRHDIIRADGLNQADRALLERSDTFYIATVNPDLADGVASGADVSHRGGRPGFVRVDDNKTITTPDFLGHFMFNTLGNLMVEPRAGLLFADFNTGDLLFAAAWAEIIWDGPVVGGVCSRPTADAVSPDQGDPLAGRAAIPSAAQCRLRPRGGSEWNLGGG